jgi:hypothetical protein
MERTDLGSMIQEVISRFNQNRIGEKPPVFVVLSPTLSRVPWQDGTLRDFVRTFLYESLVTSDPDAAINVSLGWRFELDDLSAFLGIQPTYWLQLRVSGRGLRIVERLIESLFFEIGYRCEDWLGLEVYNARVGIFGAIDAPTQKMVFCLKSSRHLIRCDLLLPIVDPTPSPGLTAGPENHRAAESSSKNDAAVIPS